MTGLANKQLDEIVSRVSRYFWSGELARPGGRPCALGLYESVALVTHLMRCNPARAVAAEFFSVSKVTVSHLWTCYAGS